MSLHQTEQSHEFTFTSDAGQGPNIPNNALDVMTNVPAHTPLSTMPTPVDRMQAYLSLYDPADIATQLRGNMTDQPHSMPASATAAFHVFVNPALEERLSDEEVSLYRATSRTNCPDGIELHAGSAKVLQVVNFELQGISFGIADTCSAFAHVLAHIVRPVTEDETQLFIITCLWMAYRMLPATDVPYCFSMPVIIPTSGSSLPDPYLACSLVGCSTPGEWEDYPEEKPALQRTRRMALGEVLLSEAFASMCEWNDGGLGDRVRGEARKIGTCAEYYTWKWILGQLRHSNGRSLLSNVTIKLVTLKKRPAVSVIIADLRDAIATAGSTPVDLIAEMNRPMGKPEFRPKILIDPCKHCRLVGTTMREVANGEWAKDEDGHPLPPVPLRVRYNNQSKGWKDWCRTLSSAAELRQRLINDSAS